MSYFSVWKHYFVVCIGVVFEILVFVNIKKWQKLVFENTFFIAD